VRFGVVYPQNELHGDPAGVHELGIAVDALGYDTLLFYDHVVGAEHADREPPLWGPYTESDTFHDPFVAFGYLAAVTSRIELATGVLVLPQRQTALAAQQAADVDLLSNERLRIGVGTGWNWVEYEALGQDFATRGARLDEQIVLMRRLWADPLVTFDGRFDHLERACINPRPRRSIPIWVGGFSEAAFRRGGTLGDGYTFAGDADDAIAGLDRVRHHLAMAGRGADDFGLELILTRARGVDEVIAASTRWQQAGGTAVCVITQKMGLDSVAAHVDYVHAAREAIDATFA
jgi:probable F420-dependent oxidoreductase